MRMAAMRGIKRPRMVTNGARAKASSAAIASKRRERAMCAAAQMSTPMRTIQVSAIGGMATLRIHLLLVRISAFTLLVSGRRVVGAVNSLAFKADLPQTGQKAAFSG